MRSKGSFRGPTASFGCIQVGRALRFINVQFGLWFVAAPRLLAGGTALAAGAGVAAGLALIALSLPRGRRSGEHFGSWDRLIV